MIRLISGYSAARVLLSFTLGLTLGAALALGTSWVADEATAHDLVINCPNRPGDIPNCVGHEHSDTMNGTGNYDHMHGYGARDWLRGEGHSDHLEGFDGPDFITGGPEQDGLQGNQGCDNVIGDAWGDNVQGNDDNDYFACDNSALEGQEGNDDIYGGTAPTTCSAERTMIS